MAINVRDSAYGAVGDGASDDAPAIQLAIDSLFSSGGGAVYFPSGTYKLNTTVSVPVGARYMLYGDGPSSILMAGSAIGDILKMAPDPGYVSQEVHQDVKITNLAFQMDATATYYIRAINASMRHQLVVDGCWFGRFIGSGTDAQASDRFKKYAKMTALYADYLNNSHFTNNFLVQIDRGVQLLNDIDDVVISHNNQSYCNNSFVNANGTGINKLMVLNNSVEETFYGHAIAIGGMRDSMICNNTLSECYENSGIVLVYCDDCIINANNCYGNQKPWGGKTPDPNSAGIRLVDSSRNIITNNRSGFAPQLRGIYIQGAGSVGNIVSNNNLRGNSIAGLVNGGTSTVIGTNIT